MTMSWASHIEGISMSHVFWPELCCSLEFDVLKAIITM
ncbi:hypothetical protein M3J09_011577 [Ascochyta lentis]